MTSSKYFPPEEAAARLLKRLPVAECIWCRRWYNPTWLAENRRLAYACTECHDHYSLAVFGDEN